MRRKILAPSLVASLLVSQVAQAELVHQWKFNGFATDSVGAAHGTLSGGAKLSDGRLELDGIDGQVLTDPLSKTLTEKTLVAWVSLNNLDQPGGGSALSVQIGDGNGGNGFDGIVYAERTPYQWMAGSDFWRRSVPDNSGDEETVTDPGEVMMAISYAADDSITIYRDGQVYASADVTSQGTLNTYEGGIANAIFGRRHDGAGNPLAGYINEARIYNTALDLGAVQSIFQTGPDAGPSPAPPLPPPPPMPTMRHQWTFNGNTEDRVGQAHGELLGGAEIQGDRLYVDGIQGSRMLSAPLGEPLKAKSIISWVSVSDVTDSTKGSALTVQNNVNGDIFDAIVYGEASAQHWMAGSNFFLRTQNPQEYGFEETVGEPGEVMMAIVYDTDNSITVYRDGVEYGRFTKGALQSYAASATVQIGPRHGDHPDVFDGYVNEARVYEGALSAADVKAIFEMGLNESGDLNGNGRFDAPDIDQLSAAMVAGNARMRFDLNSDGQINAEDRRVWVEEKKRTYFGDADLDGQFNSADFVRVFQAGQYEDASPLNSTWETGDWNGDQEFTSGDFVTAFQAGGYEQGPRPAVSAVPEPTSTTILCLLSGLAIRLVRRRKDE